MALANFTALRALITHPHQVLHYFRTAAGFAATDLAVTSSWFSAPYNNAVPTASVAVDGTSTGAFKGTAYPNNNSFITRAMGMRQTAESTNNGRSAPGLIIDRLNHSGGLSANITTLQTTNLPTTALTRYTNGVGVYAGLQIHSAPAGADTVITVLYTNSNGTTGRTGTVTWAFNTPGNRGFYIVAMQAGDMGIRSVESVQLSISTGAAGDFGVTMFKPLAMLPADIQGHDLDCTQIPGWNSTIEPNPCLELLSAGQCASIIGTIALASA